jgi:hypothetical protein
MTVHRVQRIIKRKERHSAIRFDKSLDGNNAFSKLSSIPPHMPNHTLQKEIEINYLYNKFDGTLSLINGSKGNLQRLMQYLRYE